MPIQNDNPINSPLSLSGIDTAGRVDELRADPQGRYLFQISDQAKALEYFVRATTVKEAWDVLRKQNVEGALVNTATCIMADRGKARNGDPQFSVYPKGGGPV
jgi:hypothetical protein